MEQEEQEEEEVCREEKQEAALPEWLLNRRVFGHVQYHNLQSIASYGHRPLQQPPTHSPNPHTQTQPPPSSAGMRSRRRTSACVSRWPRR